MAVLLSSFRFPSFFLPVENKHIVYIFSFIVYNYIIITPFILPLSAFSPSQHQLKAVLSWPVKKNFVLLAVCFDFRCVLAQDGSFYFFLFYQPFCFGLAPIRLFLTDWGYFFCFLFLFVFSLFFSVFVCFFFFFVRFLLFLFKGL